MSNQNTIKPTVSLIGQEGNAFAILGACSKAARKAGWTPAQIKTFTDEATAGDYDTILQTACKYFEVK